MAEKVSKDEIALYPGISVWLENHLKAKHPHATISVYDVHAVNLSDFIGRHSFKRYFPEYSTYTIKVDLVGVIEGKAGCELVFVEVKDAPLSLINLSQLVGYCKVVSPISAFLLSPQGMGILLAKLLRTFNRTDILQYDCDKPAKTIRVGRWLSAGNTVEGSTIYPPFTH